MLRDTVETASKRPIIQASPRAATADRDAGRRPSLAAASISKSCTCSQATAPPSRAVSQPPGSDNAVGSAVSTASGRHVAASNSTTGRLDSANDARWATRRPPLCRRGT